jgi:ABC-type antimicrobial peptide transport system permease subunit
MNRQSIEWVLVNHEIVRDLLGYHNGTLFFANIEENADIDYIIEEIKKINSLTIINPDQINPNYIGYFIKEYIPPANSILLVGAVFINIVGIIYIIISTDFVLEQRRRENAVLLALGGRQSKIRKIIISEIFMFIIATFIAGIPTGFISFFIALTFIKPLLIPREVIPMVIHVNPLFLAIMISSLFIASVIGILPVLRKQMKYEIVHELRAIV